MSDLVACKACLWVHFQVSRKYAEKQVKDFNKYVKTLSPKVRKELYGNRAESSVSSYEKCFRCSGPYKNFRKVKKGEVRLGSTIQPIMRRQD